MDEYIADNIKILDIRVDNLFLDEALEIIKSFLGGSRQNFIATINAEFIVDAQKDNEFKNIINSARLCFCDGVGPYLASFFLGNKLKQRISGVDLVSLISGICCDLDKKVFLLGAEHGAGKETAKVLGDKFCNLKIKSFEDQNMCEQVIFDFKPDVLFVALGAPKQERWLVENLAKFPFIKIAMGVGGAFDMISGRKKRAPFLMRKFGFEWLWRFLLEPQRIKRIFKAIVIFPFFMLKSKIKK